MVHISEFYDCNRVEIATELQYIIELGKYCFMDYNETLDLSGVIFDSILRRSIFWDYLRLALENGWVANVSVPDNEYMAIDLQHPINYAKAFRNVHIVEDEVQYDKTDDEKRKFDEDYAYRTPLDTQVIFCDKSDSAWEWRHKSDVVSDYIVNNKSLGSSGSETVWVSFFAYVATRRKFTGKPETLFVEISQNLAVMPDILSSFIILAEDTNCIYEWFFYDYDINLDEREKNHLNYQAWYYKGLQLDMLNRWFSPSEKLKYLEKLDIIEGDVVFLYERLVGNKMNYTKEIEAFFPAVVLEIKGRTIKLLKINTKNTLCGGRKKYEDYTMATKKMYGFVNPFATLNATEVTFDWNDIGVEYMMHAEQYFITPCYDDDSILTWVDNDKGDEAFALLTANEFLFWILSDYNVEYNKDRFIDRYFNGSVTVYNMFYETGELPAESIPYEDEEVE